MVARCDSEVGRGYRGEACVAGRGETANRASINEDIEVFRSTTRPAVGKEADVVSSRYHIAQRLVAIPNALHKTILISISRVSVSPESVPLRNNSALSAIGPSSSRGAIGITGFTGCLKSSARNQCGGRVVAVQKQGLHASWIW